MRKKKSTALHLGPFVALALLPELAHWPSLANMFEDHPWQLERHLRAVHGSEALQMG